MFKKFVSHRINRTHCFFQASILGLALSPLGAAFLLMVTSATR